jgi:hypothetical protein
MDLAADILPRVAVAGTMSCDATPGCIAACVPAFSDTSAGDLVGQEIELLSGSSRTPSHLTFLQQSLWALKGVFVVFVDRKFYHPPYRIKRRDMVRREKILNGFLDSSVLQATQLTSRAIKG